MKGLEYEQRARTLRQQITRAFRRGCSVEHINKLLREQEALALQSIKEHPGTYPGGGWRACTCTKCRLEQAAVAADLRIANRLASR